MAGCAEGSAAMTSHLAVRIVHSEQARSRRRWLMPALLVALVAGGIVSSASPAAAAGALSFTNQLVQWQSIRNCRSGRPMPRT